MANLTKQAMAARELISNSLSIKKENKISEYAKLLGSRGGKQSAKKRLEGKTKEEISEIMRKMRYSKKQSETIKEMGENVVEGLRKIS
jgi:flavorubredoxin